MSTLTELLRLMIAKEASDLHITTGSPPRLRIAGRLLPIAKSSPLSHEDTETLCFSVMTAAQKRRFEENLEVDISFGIKGLSRFRANIFMQRGSPAGAFRPIPIIVKTLEELGLPPEIGKLADNTHGLVLITGPTGSGKSTTLSSMIDRINTSREAHIVTVEDPMEFMHTHKKSLINQREVDSDTSSFSAALRRILRQDPDVVMISDLHDPETVESALIVSEMRHLTLGALNTGSALQTINRLIAFFPPYKQDQARTLLASVLEGIVSQRLVPSSSGKGKVAAVELLIPSPGVRGLISENRLQQVYSMMQSADASPGLRSMNNSLLELYTKGLITEDTAVNYSPFPDEILQMLTKSSGVKGRNAWAGKRNLT